MNPIPLCWPDAEGRCACGRGHQGGDIGKAPLLGKGWQTHRTTDGDCLAWGERWPWANVGAVLDLSGLVFVGPDGDKGQAEAEANGLPPTATDEGDLSRSLPNRTTPGVAA